MKIRLKPLNQQTIVITGASSGIGLSTARTAARRGARVVLAARSEDALRNLSDEINNAGGQALAFPVDAADRDAVGRLAAAAIERFGGFDTWVNDAAVSIYGPVAQVPLADARRLFETNLWGTVNGSLAAVEHLRHRGGGAVINVGSTVSDRAIPMQGFYSASKHAVKGFTDALRVELEAERAPIAVTLIKPGSIDTPFPQHAKNLMDREPTLPPPVYAPAVVADAILHCCEVPTRDLFVGGGGKAISALGQWSPRLADKQLRSMIEQQKKPVPSRGRDDRALYRGNADLRERGDYDGHVMKSSAYTKATMHPIATGALIAAGAAIVAGALVNTARATD